MPSVRSHSPDRSISTAYSAACADVLHWTTMNVSAAWLRNRLPGASAAGSDPAVTRISIATVAVAPSSSVAVTVRDTVAPPRSARDAETDLDVVVVDSAASVHAVSAVCLYSTSYASAAATERQVRSTAFCPSASARRFAGAAGGGMKLTDLLSLHAPSALHVGPHSDMNHDTREMRKH